MCRQDLTSKPLVVPLYVIVCPVVRGHQVAENVHDMGALS